MAAKVEYQVIMWAEMTPDVYGGKECNEHVPQWHTHAEGDMGPEHVREPIALDPKLFPPGTKIRVEVPCCPGCGLSADYDRDGDSCECGFDWKAWAEDRYS